MDYNHIQQNLNQISTLSQASDTNVKNKNSPKSHYIINETHNLKTFIHPMPLLH